MKKMRGTLKEAKRSLSQTVMNDFLGCHVTTLFRNSVSITK